MMGTTRTYRFTDDPEARDEVAALLSDKHGSTFQFRHYRLRTAVAMFGAGMAAVVVIAALSRALSVPHDIAVWLVFAAALAGVYLWRRYTIFANRRMAEEAHSDSPLTEGETIWEMSADGLNISNAVSDIHLKWAALDTVLKGTKGLGLGSSSVFFVIPTAAVGSKADVDALCREIANWRAA